MDAADLVARYLDGDIDAPGIAELEGWLKADEANLRSFMREVHDQRSLRTAARGRSERRSHGFASGGLRARPARRTRRRPPSWATPIAAAAAAAVLIAVVVAGHHRAIPAVARLSGVSGEVAVRRGGEPVAAAGDLRAGDQVTIGDGRAAIVFADGTQVELGERGTAVAIEAGSPGEAKRLRLERGALAATVAKQPSAAPMRLVTPWAEAVVRGTRLQLAVGGRATRLEVSEGSVDLERGGERVAVAAGGYAVAESGAAIAVGRLADAAPPVAAIPPAAGAPLVSFAVEDGARPVQLRDGEVVAGPARAGNRFCIAGKAKPHEQWLKHEVVLEQLHVPLVAATPGLRISFDCWIGAATGTFGACMWDSEQAKTFALDLPDVPRRTWTRVTLAVDDLRVADEPALRIRPGDQLLNLAIAAFGGADDELYVDNLAIGVAPDGR